MIVLDASVLTNVLLGRQPELEDFELETAPFHAPALVEVEILQALRGLVRSGQVTESHAEDALAAFTRVRRVLYSHEPFLWRAWELRHELTAYDAMYLAVTERIGAVLVTADRALARRARRLLGADRVRLV